MALKRTQIYGAGAGESKSQEEKRKLRGGK